MYKVYFFILFFFFNIFNSQKKFYEFPIIDGNKIITMRQTNELIQNNNRLLANFIVNNKKSEKLYYASSLIISGLLLQPITHEEGHRSVLTELKIGAVSQPILDKNFTAKVEGVTDATLKNLRDTDLPDYIRLHTAGLESDFTYLNSLNSKLSFEEEEMKFVKGDILARNVGVAGYYLTSLISRKFSLDEFAKPELERDVVGHDIWGMIRHLHRPEMDFHRYTTWDELTSEERKYANRTAIFSLINFANPNLFGIRNFTLSNGSNIGGSIGYSLSPFGDYLQQNVYLLTKKGLKLNPYLIEYFNKTDVFFGAGIKLHNYEIGNKFLMNSSIDLWSQPENLSFTGTSGKFGAGIKLNGGYKFASIEKEKKNSFYIDLGITAKTKGFLPEAPSLKNDFRMNLGIIYTIN